MGISGFRRIQNYVMHIQTARFTDCSTAFPGRELRLCLLAGCFQVVYSLRRNEIPVTQSIFVSPFDEAEAHQISQFLSNWYCLHLNFSQVLPQAPFYGRTADPGVLTV